MAAAESAHPLKPTVFLDQALIPLRPWFENPDVVEILINGPGDVFIEILGAPAMQRHHVDRLGSDAIRNLAERVAGWSDQSVNEETPLLSAALPSGERFQAVLPPAAPNGGAIAIRKQVVKNLSIDDYARLGAFNRVSISRTGKISATDRGLNEMLAKGDIAAFLRQAVAQRYSILISGGTSTGKTTFLNALLKLVPDTDRILSIEDTRELFPPQPNYVPLVASKGGQGLSTATIQSLLEASLRMRPDRIFLGELRGAEAWTFLRAVNTGHPGSLTTIHADSPDMAYEQMMLMVLQANLGLKREEILAYTRAVLPVCIQLTRQGGWRGVSEIQFSKFRDVAAPAGKCGSNPS